jgi:hypothetical protein
MYTNLSLDELPVRNGQCIDQPDAPASQEMSSAKSSSMSDDLDNEHRQACLSSYIFANLSRARALVRSRIWIRAGIQLETGDLLLTTTNLSQTPRPLLCSIMYQFAIYIHAPATIVPSRSSCATANTNCHTSLLVMTIRTRIDGCEGLSINASTGRIVSVRWTMSGAQNNGGANAEKGVGAIRASVRLPNVHPRCLFRIEPNLTRLGHGKE